jgi:hypothetical protein
VLFEILGRVQYEHPANLTLGIGEERIRQALRWLTTRLRRNLTAPVIVDPVQREALLFKIVDQVTERRALIVLAVHTRRRG